MKFNNFRCHPTIIIANSFKIIIAAVVYLIGSAEAFITDSDYADINEYVTESKIIMLLILLILAVYIAVRFFAWRKTYISIENDSFIYDKRTIFFQKKISVKLENISTVNLQKGIVDRIFGTYTVKLDINSSATAETTDFHLVFKENFAKELSEYILKMKCSEDAFSKIQSPENYNTVKNETGNTDAKPILEFKTKNILLHTLLMMPMGHIISIIALLSGVSLPVIKASSAFYVLALILGIPAALVIAFVSLFIKNIFLYYNFTVSKAPNEIIISFGLVTRRIYRLPVDKTGGVVVKQSFWGRIFKKYYAEILNVGMGDEEKEMPVFCLMLNRQQLKWVLDTVIPEFSVDFELEKSPKEAFVPTIVKGLLVCLPILAVVNIMGSLLNLSLWGVVVSVFAIAITVFTSFAAYRAKGLEIKGNKLTVATGILSRRIIIVPFYKIQKVTVKSGPVSQKVGVSRGEISILSNLVNRDNSIGYFKPERFKQIILGVEGFEK